MVGRDYETKCVATDICVFAPTNYPSSRVFSTPFHVNRNFSFDDVHVKGAELIASIAAQNGVDEFVHVSHLNAAHDSPSAFYRSKAKGEELVKEAFPDATIVRPSIMFGYEDKLLNNIASECFFSSAFVIRSRLDHE